MSLLETAMFRARAGKFETPSAPVRPPLPVPSRLQPESAQALLQYCRELENAHNSLKIRYRDLQQFCEKQKKHIEELTAPPKYVSFGLIKQITCKTFHVDRDDVLSKDRSMFITLARQTICYLAHTHIRREGKQASFSWIGRQLHLDHSSVMTAWRLIGNRRLKEPELDTRISGIEQQLHKAVQP